MTTTYKLTDNNGVSHFTQANTVDDAIHQVCHLYPNLPGEIVRAEAVKVFGVSTGEQGYGAGDIFGGTEFLPYRWEKLLPNGQILTIYPDYRFFNSNKECSNASITQSNG